MLAEQSVGAILALLESISDAVAGSLGCARDGFGFFLTCWREEAVEGALDSVGLDLQTGPDDQHDGSNQ